MDKSATELFEDFEARFLDLGKKKLPTFFKQKELPALRIEGTANPVDDVIVRGVVNAFVKERASFYNLFRDIFSREDADAFALVALEMWEAQGFHGRYGWMTELLATLGGDHTAIELERHLQSWQRRTDTWRKRAIASMYVLERMDTPTSLMALVGLTQRQERPSVYDEAVRQLHRAASRRKLGWETLSDQVVPTCELDMRGTRVFDLGGRTLRVVLDEDFVPRLRGEERELLDEIPSIEDGDDPTLYADAASAWGLMREQLVDVLDIQTRRMEHAMVSGRRWRPEDWKTYILEHPLMINFARRLVWGSFDKYGALVSTFRATEDHSLMNVEDDEVELDMSFVVGILHPADLPDKELQDWAQSFAEYELFSPFQQLDRLVIRPPREKSTRKTYTKYADETFKEGALRRLMKEEMWRRETGSGNRRYFYKDLEGDGVCVRAYVDLSPGLSPGGEGYDPDQKIPKVRFESLGGGERAKFESLMLKEVPDVAFSEACRFVEMVKLAQEDR
jgi:hypothetical protein